MEISSIYIKSNPYNSNPSFKTNAVGLGKSVLRPDLVQNFTHFFRLGYDIDLLADKIIKLQNAYKHKKPVDVIVCGCSDGTKAFEIQMSLVSRFIKDGISLDNIPNIKAFDIDKDMIEIAKNGRINISDYEFTELQKKYPSLISGFWGNRGELIKISNDNIKKIEKDLGPIRYSYQYNPKLLEKINFYVADIFEELPKLKSDVPQIVSCENIAIYFDELGQEKLAKTFKDNLCPGSYLLIGLRDGYDIPASNKFLNKLKDKYFKNDKTISLEGCQCALEKNEYHRETGFCVNYLIKN
jgi:chemotaxis methyl-accepting protein methylase